jgi:CheY-like chemotaxis protein
MGTTTPIILLVEDEPDLLQVLTEAVGRAQPDYHVVAAASAAEAHERLDEAQALGRPVALAMVDHVLGGEEANAGLGVLESVRNRFPGAATFLFTGQASARVEQRALAIGTRVLWKPLRLATILGEVGGALA